MARIPLLGAALVALALTGSAVRAADTSEADQLREQLRATVLQLRQLQDQQASAQAPVVAPPSDDVTKKLAAVKAQLRSARRAAAKAASLQAELDKAKADLTDLAARLATATTDVERTHADLVKAEDADRALTAEREGLKQQLTRMTGVAVACQAKNARLADFAGSMIKFYRRPQIHQVLDAAEPLLGLKRVELENITQEREDTVRANQCDAGLLASPPNRPSGG